MPRDKLPSEDRRAEGAFMRRNRSRRAHQGDGSGGGDTPTAQDLLAQVVDAGREEAARVALQAILDGADVVVSEAENRRNGNAALRVRTAAQRRQLQQQRARTG